MRQRPNGRTAAGGLSVTHRGGRGHARICSGQPSGPAHRVERRASFDGL